MITLQKKIVLTDPQPRYWVMVNGKLFDELYFNLTGYVGYLPTPNGGKLTIGEKSITAYKKEIAILNREWKNA